MKKTIIFLVAVAAVLLFVVASIVGGLQIEGYSFVSQYISESYATGIPNSGYLQYLYICSGLLLALFGFITPTLLLKSRAIKIPFFGFAVFYGLGTVITGFFPCDLGCQPDAVNPSISQFIHNATGFLTYTIVPFCLISIGFLSKKVSELSKFSRVSLICGCVSFVFVFVLFTDPKGSFIGLYQRIIESSILFWVIYVAYYIRKTPKR